MRRRATRRSPPPTGRSSRPPGPAFRSGRPRARRWRSQSASVASAGNGASDSTRQPASGRRGSAATMPCAGGGSPQAAWTCSDGTASSVTLARRRKRDRRGSSVSTCAASQSSSRRSPSAMMKKSARYLPCGVSRAAQTAVPPAAWATSLDTRPCRNATRSCPATAMMPLPGSAARCAMLLQLIRLHPEARRNCGGRTLTLTRAIA